MRELNVPCLEVESLLSAGMSDELASLYAHLSCRNKPINPRSAYCYLATKAELPIEEAGLDQISATRAWPHPLPSDGFILEAELLPKEYQKFAKSGSLCASEVQEAVQAALSLLSKLETDRIARSAKWIVPIFGISSVAETSFSSIVLPWVIFISPKSVRRTLEAIVHEAAHQELFILEAILDYKGDWSLAKRHNFGDSFYSPWRNENRPAIGILHGAYVFSRVKRVVGTFSDLDHKLDLQLDDGDQSSNISAVVPFLYKTFTGTAFEPLVKSLANA